MGFWSSNKSKVPGRIVVSQSVPNSPQAKRYGSRLLGTKEPISCLFENEFSAGFETIQDTTWGWDANLETDCMVQEFLKPDQNKSKQQQNTNSTSNHLTAPSNNLKSASESGLSQVKENNSSQNSSSRLQSQTPEYDTRAEKFQNLLNETNISLDVLRKLSWKGIPTKYRAESWKLLLGYSSSNSERRQDSLNRKRLEYFNISKQLFSNGEDSLDKTIYQQISIDLPRTFPTITLFHQPQISKIMERILYTWSIRHPASGYVQGINDIVTPFIYVFLIPYIPEGQDPEEFDVSTLSEETLSFIEADSFWCFSKLMDGIQDNYTFAQRGIQRQLTNLKLLIERAEYQLAQHLCNENVEFIQFAFRWMNCLLLREVNLKSAIRMWDTYLSEGFDNFSDFHLYVCAAFLKKFKQELSCKDFQEILLFLQNPPTKNWKESDIELLLSEAYLLQSLFKNAPNLWS